MPKNPNGYGCVTKLSGTRSRPWMARVTVYDGKGIGRQVPVGYAATREEALVLLAKYNDDPWDIDRDKVTLSDVYTRWQEVKAPKLSTANQGCLQAAYRHLSRYYGAKYRALRSYQMQETIDDCGLGYATQANIKNLWGHLDRFAYELDIIDKMYSQLLTSAPVKESTRTPFTREQVDAIWAISDTPWADTVLMYLYTGFRVTELLQVRTEDVHLEPDWYIQGGLKTASGKSRIVPIHERLKPLVAARYDAQAEYFLHDAKGSPLTRYYYLKHWDDIMRLIGADKTPHEARHTFETELDNARANRKCIDLLMGHKSKDVGNRVYNHKTIEQLREAVNLLK